MSGEEIVARLLDHPVAFRRAFVWVSGSVTAGLMLSQAYYWTKIVQQTKPDDNGWFYKTQAEWTDEICLTRWEQDGARKLLRGLTFWEEDRRGVPPRSYFRLDLDRLHQAVLHYVEKPHSRLREKLASECGKTSVQNAENRQFLKGTKTTSKTTQREHASAARSGELFEEVLFDTWWDSYPRKLDRLGCHRIWAEMSVLDRAAAFEAVRTWKTSTQWQDPKFVPNPATFLKRRQWENAPAEDAHGSNSGNRRTSGAVAPAAGKYDHRKPDAELAT